MAAKRVLALGMLWHSAMAGALLASAPASQRVLQHEAGVPPRIESKGPRQLQGRFLHITDIHPDEFYKTHSSTAEGDACHRGKGPAGSYGAETSDCDSPYSLVNATFDWIQDNLKDQIDFVIWTGDSARHDSDEKIPRSAAEVLGSNQWVASKFVDAFSDSKSKALEIPIVPTFGNNDILPHNILLPGPNKWLSSYAKIWKRFIPEEQLHSFEFGGWFYIEVIPNKLAVFSLNTLYFFDRNAGVDDCAQPSEPGFKQMEWLRIQLEFLRRRGVKAILTGHVPPARTDSKMLWDETCWQKYTLWLRQYSDVVVGSVYGHMNIDHFLLADTKEINLDLLGATGADFSVRTAMEDELSIESTADYLRELRAGWSKLPKPLIFSEEANEQAKGDSKKKPGGKWAQRFQVSLVGPSVVPNYFPTLRVVEYNISGLESTATWTDTETVRNDEAVDWSALDQYEVVVRDVIAEKGKGKEDKDEKAKPKKPQHGEKKKPKDPHLVIPDPPAKSSPPGPAYSVQPLTFLGYTQYYANLTHINNDMTHDGDDVESSRRWREGKHGGNKPKQPGKPKPRDFEFEVEYSTFTDKIYNLSDLTVDSFVTLAYQMGQVDVSTVSDLATSTVGVPVDDEVNDDDGSTPDEDLGAQGDKKKGKKGKKGKGKKHKKAYKTWIHFLTHAFVSSVDAEELEKL